MPLVGIVTLFVVWTYYRSIKKEDPGDEKMVEIHQANVWYTLEDRAQKFLQKLIQNIEEYDGENWIDKRVEVYEEQG